MASPRIGELLVEHGVITPHQLNTALQIQTQKGGRIGDVLLGLGALTEVQLQHFLARQFNLSFYRSSELVNRQLDLHLLDLVPYEKALEQLILPLGFLRDGDCEIATLTPMSEIQEALLRDKLKCDTITYALADRPSLVKAIRHHYGQYMLSQTEQAFDGQTKMDDEKKKRYSAEINKMRREGLYQPRGSNDPFLREHLGNWEMVRLLGEGGMGLVYEGVHTQTKQRAAIKILRTKLNVDDVAVQRFYREVQIMRRLHHAGIIEIYEFEFREDLGFYLVMELLEGCTFADFLATLKVDLSFASTYRVFSAVCEAMSYAHQQSIVHRDLKPDNIYLVGSQTDTDDIGSGPIKILDFGIAKLQQEESHRLTQTGSTLGTPHYISPEQAVAGDVDHRADIYSLAVILFEVLTQKSLFEADSPFQYLMRHVYAEPPSLEQARPDRNFPPGLNDLVQRGLAKKPDDRPADMASFRAELRRVLQPYLDGVIEETPSSPQIQSAHHYHYRKDQEEGVLSPSGSALPTGTPASPGASFFQSDEWDNFSEPNLEPVRANNPKPKPKPKSKPKPKPKSSPPASASGMSSQHSSSKSTSPKKKSGGILGLGEPIGTGDSSNASGSPLSEANRKERLGIGSPSSRPSVRSSRSSGASKTGNSKKKGVVIHSPRWDVSSRSRRGGRLLVWVFLLLVLGAGGGAAYFYKDKLMPPPATVKERRAAKLAWKSWHRKWYKANRDSWVRRRRRYRRRRYRGRRYRRRRRRVRKRK